MSKSHKVAVKIHNMIELNDLREIAYKFAGIIKSYANIIEKEAKEEKILNWKQKELLHQDPLIRVCLDHMVRISGGTTDFGVAPGYGLLFAMIDEGMQEPCPVRSSRLKDIRPDKQENNQPGNDIYADDPYDGGQKVHNERDWLFLNCSINDLEDRDAT